MRHTPPPPGGGDGANCRRDEDGAAQVRFLFVHQNFPGQYLHLVRDLAAQGRHEVVFVTGPNENRIPGVRKVSYRLPRGPGGTTHADAQEFEYALLRAEAVAGVAAALKGLGFTPDIVIGHHGWGELLNLHDVWPRVPLLGYHEFYYATHGLDVGFDPEFPTPPGAFSRIRAKNAAALLALTNPGHGQTPTGFQLGTYPAWARPGIALLPEGVDLALCRPDPLARARPFRLGGIEVTPGERLVTYVARDLEPYRGFHVMMRALPGLLRARPDLRAVLVGGDGVSYGLPPPRGTWREHMLAEVGGAIDPARVHFPGKLPHADYLRLLQRSDAHVYLTYPFVASWSLREALACGCALVAGDTAPVREFVLHGRTGVLTPCLDSAGLAERVLDVLEDTRTAARLRAGARAWAEAELRLHDHLAGYGRLIERVLDGTAHPTGPGREEPHGVAEAP